MDASVDRAADRQAVATLLDALQDAWGRADADAYASFFTADAPYTTWLGTQYQGRHDIAESHRALFHGFLKGTRLAGEIRQIRFCGPDTALVTARGDTYKGKTPTTLCKVQTYTLVREADGRWQIAAFHNTKRRPLMEAISFLFAPRTRPATPTTTPVGG
jgi:uncharacterized protein (TIGR02246 family)